MRLFWKPPTQLPQYSVLTSLLISVADWPGGHFSSCFYSYFAITPNDFFYKNVNFITSRNKSENLINFCFMEYNRLERIHICMEVQQAVGKADLFVWIAGLVLLYEM